MTIDVPVMIAGAGPVGLTLGLELSHQGIPCFIAERNLSTTSHPKMDVTNCRSMELYRRLGVVDRLRAAGVPEDHNMDVVWVTGMSGYEIHRFRYPSVVEAREKIRRVNDGAQALEPNMRISQIVLEPLLRDILFERSDVALRYGWTVDSFVQDEDGVTTTIRNSETGEPETIRSQYLVGCDGGGSQVRRQLGIAMSGEARTRRRFTIHFRSTDYDVLQRWGIAWHYQSPAHGTMICQDDREMWTLHAVLPDGLDAEDADPRSLLFDFLGTEIDCEILQANGWMSHMLLADSYRDGRVFLAGDSAHQVVPTGGYGMNTGVGDAVDIGWKLAAVLSGWGGPALLDSYEPERRSIGFRNREAARFHTGTRQAVAEIWEPRLDEPGEEGDRLRAEIGARIAALGNAENESLGVEIGYRYEDSPVICDEAGEPPPLDIPTYAPTTWPGARTPSVFLADGSALFDHFGPGFTLVGTGGSDVDTKGFEAAAKKRGVPFDVLRLDEPAVGRIYECPLVLVRPDQHVAWRGDGPPSDPAAIVDKVRGAG